MYTRLARASKYVCDTHGQPCPANTRMYARTFAWMLLMGSYINKYQHACRPSHTSMSRTPSMLQTIQLKVLVLGLLPGADFILQPAS
jgi:hypothetical protein